MKTKLILTGIYRLMENYSQTFINKDFFLHFFLHSIAKKWLKIQNNKGNYDLRKTLIYKNNLW